MTTFYEIWSSTFAGMVLFGVLGFSSFASTMLGSEHSDARQHVRKLYDQGNFKDAYDGYRKLVLDPEDDPLRAGEDLSMAVQCLQQLSRVVELDSLLEEAVDVHKANARFLSSAAQSYMTIPHYGVIVAGKFQRGSQRGGGQRAVNAEERDRVRALQLMVQGMQLVREGSSKDRDLDVGEYYSTMADMWNNDMGEAWRRQTLTDLSTLPDYEDRWGRYTRHNAACAPVGIDGQPILYPTPKTFENAENDGQRWRWCLQQAAEVKPALINHARWKLAEFLLSQFGVQTMAESGWRFDIADADDAKEAESGTYALHTLKDNETIARLATGIKRFELPDEFNYIKLFQQIADSKQVGGAVGPGPYAVQSMEQLADIFQNRRQYPKAAEYWQRLLKEFPGADKDHRNLWQRNLDQIVGNWGRFEPTRDQPAGRGATVDYRFRNGKQVEFTAHAILVEKLLNDVKALLKSRPKELQWDQISIDDIGFRLVEKNQKQYVGEQVAQWRMDLKPRESHFDSRVTVTTPLQKSGAYLLTAKMADGNTNFIVVWIDDMAIVKKPLNRQTMYYVADAVSGKSTLR